VYTLTEQGILLLESAGALGDAVPLSEKALGGIPDLGHLLFLNDCRVQLTLMQRTIPGLEVRFLPSVPGVNAGMESIIRERFHHGNGPDDLVEFTPDGVFSITHTPTGRALLFFLEVDMGTETLVSKRHSGQDVRQKIINYQTYFRSKRYQRYEGVFGRPFRGFRLLVATSNAKRYGDLCQLVLCMPPSDFIWLTDKNALETEGVWSTIWTRGGHLDRVQESILGSLLPSPSPSPSTIS